jgi:DNA invertase Pin-like site-specific DNA recombinase
MAGRERLVAAREMKAGMIETISKMVFTTLAAVAEDERDRIRERNRDAKRPLTSRGVFRGQYPGRSVMNSSLTATSGVLSSIQPRWSVD